MPAAADPDQRLLGGRELDQLLLGEGRVADRELPVEPGERVGREQAARAACGARGGEVDAEPARRGDPVPRQQHGHAELLQPRDRRAEDEADVVVARARSWSARPGRRRGRPRRGRARSARAGGARRSAGSAERRKPKTASPPSCSSEVGRARVGSSAACSHSSSTTRGRASPRSRSSARSSSRRLSSHGALERRSRPRSTQSVSRRSSAPSPACGGSSGSIEVRPSRKSSGALGRLRMQPVAEPHARRAEAVAGDLVDGAGVEVVHERVPVAVERVARRRRAGRRRSRRAPPAPTRRSWPPSRRATCGRRAAAAGGGGLPSPTARRARATANVARAEPPSSRSGGGSAASAISSASPTRRARRALPELRQIGDRRDPERAARRPRASRRRPRASTVALTSCCHRISSVARSESGSSSIGSGADTNLSGYV